MSDVFMLVIAVLLVPALIHWRLALITTLVVGFAQDVLRKSMPGEPVYMVMLFAPVFALAAIGLLMRGGKLSLEPLFELHPELRLPVLVFFCVVAMQIVVALSNTGSVMLAALGVLVYMLPFVALLVAMYFANSVESIAGALKVYIFMSAVFCVGVYLNVLGYQEGLLDSVGVGLYVYPLEGGVLKLPSGFFRAPEIAAWHCATAIAFTVLLVMLRMFPGGMLFGIVVILLLLGAVVLTGRRKMVVELFIFAGVLTTLLMYYRDRSLRLVVFSAVLVLVLFVFQLLFIQDHSGVELNSYVSRYGTVAQEAGTRLKVMTVDSFQWVIAHNGWIGAGAGTASQGAAQFGGGIALVGGATEGGLAKVLAELGVHGLLVCAWLMAGFAYACHASIRDARDALDWRWPVLAIGLLSLIGANILVFATASQVFGDPFVLLMLGLMLGFVLRARGQGAAHNLSVSNDSLAAEQERAG